MIVRHKGGYDISGYGLDEGALYNLSKFELHTLMVDIAAQNLNDEFEDDGTPKKEA